MLKVKLRAGKFVFENFLKMVLEGKGNFFMLGCVNYRKDSRRMIL